VQARQYAVSLVHVPLQLRLLVCCSWLLLMLPPLLPLLMLLCSQ
jgi:hypothetical protein